eukprot:1375120-Amorphochlora_amoeboformis.AAC.1
MMLSYHVFLSSNNKPLHLRHDWFANHFVCPVAKCDCRCMQLDEPALRVRDAGDGYVVPA